MTCECGGRRLSAPVAVVLVSLPYLPRPLPLLPDVEYRICIHCDAPLVFVHKAVASHSVASQAGRWTYAVILFDDGAGLELRQPPLAEQPTQPGATA